MEIVPQRAGDEPAIEALLDAAFGADRHRKTSYRLRDGVACDTALSFVALVQGEIVGTIRFWPVAYSGGERCLLLGPIAVARALAGKGIGRALIGQGLAAAAARGYELVFLVGDSDYYGRLGFTGLGDSVVSLPGPVEPGRLHFRRLGGAGNTPAGRLSRLTPPGKAEEHHHDDHGERVVNQRELL